MKSKGGGEIGEAKGNMNFAGDRAAVDEELTFGGGNQRDMGDDGVVVPDIL